MALPPGPRAPSPVQAISFVRRPVEFLERCRDRYGDCFSASFPAVGRVVYVCDPEIVKQLYTGPPDRFHAGEANGEMFEPVMGTNSVMTLDEDDHMRQRKLLLPPFQGDRIRPFERTFVEAADREIDGWPLGEPFPLLPAMRRITMEVILRAVLGLRDEGRIRELSDAMLRLDAQAGIVLPFTFMRRDLGPGSPWRRFVRARDDLDRLFYTEIAERRAAPDADEREDVLSVLLASRYEDSSPMSDVELRDEIVTLMAAGYETSSTTLGWVFERILRHPDVLARLHDDPGDTAYLDAVVNETMRVRSPVTDSTRILTAKTEVGGHELPARTQVIVALPLLHRRADAWPEPLSFDPERFLERKPAPYTFIPFGGGVRRCLGAPFAQLEMRAVLRTALERTELRAAEPDPERMKLHHVTVIPARGTRAVLDRRRPVPERPAEATAGRDPSAEVEAANS